MIPSSSQSDLTALLFEQSTSQSEQADTSPPAHQQGALPPCEPESNAVAATSSLRQGTPAPPAERSPFDTSMIELVLQLLPDDGHQQGRRVRYALTIGGKTLVIGGRRVHDLWAQCAACTDGGARQLLGLLEQYVARRQQQLRQVLPQRAAGSSRSASRSPATSTPPQAAWLDRSQAEQKHAQPGQADDVTTSPSQSPPVDKLEKPQQLDLFEAWHTGKDKLQ